MTHELVIYKVTQDLYMCVYRSVTPSDSTVEMEQVMPCEKMQVESLSAGFSSEESDDENREEFPHLPVSICHPKPLGVGLFHFCTNMLYLYVWQTLYTKMSYSA